MEFSRPILAPRIGLGPNGTNVIHFQVCNSLATAEIENCVFDVDRLPACNTPDNTTV